MKKITIVWLAVIIHCLVCFSANSQTDYGDLFTKQLFVSCDTFYLINEKAVVTATEYERKKLKKKLPNRVFRSFQTQMDKAYWKTGEWDFAGIPHACPVSEDTLSEIFRRNREASEAFVIKYGLDTLEDSYYREIELQEQGITEIQPCLRLVYMVSLPLTDKTGKYQLIRTFGTWGAVDGHASLLVFKKKRSGWKLFRGYNSL